MNNARLVAPAGIALLAFVVCAAPASAQRPRPDRVYRGLFGGGGVGPNSRQALDVNISLFGAYDDNVLAALPGTNVDPRYQQSGGYGGATVSLDYTRHRGQTTFDFTGGTSYRYYPSYKAASGSNSFVSAGLTTKLSPRTTLAATESAAYSPYYALGAIPGAPPGTTGDVAPINPQYPLLQQSIISLYSSASVGHETTLRSSLAVDYAIAYTDYRHTPQSYGNWTTGGNYSYKLSRRTSMQLGYHYRRANYVPQAGLSRSDRIHDITFGMDYTRPLSPSRTMTMGFTLGTSLYSTVTPFEVAPGVNFYLSNHVLANGSAYVSRQFGQSWSGRLTYSRGLQYVQGFPTPFYSDSVSGGLDGHLNAKTSVHLGTAYSSGQIRPTGVGQGYSTYSGQAGGQVAVNQYLALFAEYNYYHYRFDQAVVLPTGINQGLNRQSVRVGANIWLPILR